MPSGKRFQRISIGLLTAVAIAGSLPLYGKSKSDGWEVAMNSGRSALRSGDYNQARRDLNSAMDSSKLFRTNDPRLGDTYQAFGDLYLGEQDYAQAKEYFNRALMVQQTTPGIDELKLADTLYGLATASEMLGDRELAVILLKRVRDIWSNKHGAHSPKLRTVLKPLGIYSDINGDLKFAEQCFRDLIAIDEAAGNSSEVGCDLNLLSATLTKEGKLSDAAASAERAVSLLNKSSDSLIAAESARDNLSFIKQQQGQSDTRIAVETPKSNDTVIRSVEPAKPAVAAKAPEVKKPVEPTKIVEGTKPVQATKPIEATKPVETIPAEPAKPTTATKPEPGTTVEPAKPLLASKPTEITKPSEPTKPAGTGQKPATDSETKKVLGSPSTAAVTTQATEFRPWEGGDNHSQTSKTDANWGKIRYLADGKLITQEEYQALQLANQAYELIRTEKYRMAADVLKKALSIAPTLASVHTNLGMALTQLGDTSEAVAHLREAIAIDASRSAAWLNLATAFQLSGDLKAASVTYAEYVRRFPSDQLASKASELAKHLGKEATEQATIASSAGGSSAPDYFAYTSHTAGPVRWVNNSSKIKVYIRPASGVPGYKTEYDGFCADAFKQWSEASKDRIAFEFVKKPEGADIEWIWTNDISQVSSVAEGGETNVNYENGKIKHATITVLTKNPSIDTPLSPNQIRAVSLHEIGHAVGLIGHSPRPQDIMYCSMPPALSHPSLTTRDINTIEKLYSQSISYVIRLLRHS